jgi:hypothetical protein
MRTRLLAVAAGSLALALGTSVAASASQGPGTAGKAETAKQAVHHTAFSTNSAPPEDTWQFGLDGRDSAGNVWNYPPKSTGGFGARVKSGTGLGGVSAFFKNNSANDGQVNVYARFGGQLRIFTSSTSSTGSVIGNGWDIYSAFVTPGNIGGAANPDLLARDKGGVLWEYLSNSNGTFAPRVKVGAGWNIYSQIAGRDDITGDGKADIVARDYSGNLWLYKGTGNYKAPFATRTKIGAGWNIYNKILALGDTNVDGHNDLIARDSKGVLWLYEGTGNAAAPYQKRVQIGTGWNIYNYLF